MARLLAHLAPATTALLWPLLRLLLDEQARAAMHTRPDHALPRQVQGSVCPSPQECTCFQINKHMCLARPSKSNIARQVGTQVGGFKSLKTLNP